MSWCARARILDGCVNGRFDYTSLTRSYVPISYTAKVMSNVGTHVTREEARICRHCRRLSRR